MRRKIKNNKIGLFFAITIIALSTIGIGYSLWYDELFLQGTIHMANWDENCIQINKTAEGAFTDPITGQNTTTPTNLIAIAATFPTTFHLTITVKNCGTQTLTNVIVTDTIGQGVGPYSWTPSTGTVTWIHRTQPPGQGGEIWDGIHFAFNDLTWTIGTMQPGDIHTLFIELKTLQNPEDKYEPTSESQQLELQLSDKGATITADTSDCGQLTATTKPITLEIQDPNPSTENPISEIITILPYTTPTAYATCSLYT